MVTETGKGVDETGAEEGPDIPAAVNTVANKVSQDQRKTSKHKEHAKNFHDEIAGSREAEGVVEATADNYGQCLFCLEQDEMGWFVMRRQEWRMLEQQDSLGRPKLSTFRINIPSVLATLEYSMIKSVEIPLIYLELLVQYADLAFLIRYS